MTRSKTGWKTKTILLGHKPPDYEDLKTLQINKPSLQQVLYYTNQLGSDAESGWRNYLDYYYWLQVQVDVQIGRVLQALQARPEIAENTLIIFTADHGDHGGSHGLHEKSMTVYEESIHLPLFVCDPTGRRTRFEEIPRPQLTSSVDLFPLLLTIATGDRSWENNSQFFLSFAPGRLGWIVATSQRPGTRLYRFDFRRIFWRRIRSEWNARA